MKYSIIKKSLLDYEKDLKSARLLCFLGIALALIINLVLTLASKDQNMTLFLVLNIFTDIIFGLIIYSYYILKVENAKKMLTLYRKEKDVLQGVVENVDTKQCTHHSIDCKEVRINERVLFLPINTFDIFQGDNVTVYFTSNIIVEVEK